MTGSVELKKGDTIIKVQEDRVPSLESKGWEVVADALDDTVEVDSEEELENGDTYGL